MLNAPALISAGLIPHGWVVPARLALATVAKISESCQDTTHSDKKWRTTGGNLKCAILSFIYSKLPIILAGYATGQAIDNYRVASADLTFTSRAHRPADVTETCSPTLR